MPAGLGSLVIQLQVFFTILLAFVVFGERPHVWQVTGALVAFAGIGVIAVERLDGAALLPLLLMIAAALFWGLGNMTSKKAGRVDMLGLVVWSSLIPPLPLLALSLIFEGPGAIPATARACQLAWHCCRCLHVLWRHAVRLQHVGATAQPLSGQRGLAVRAVHSGGRAS